MVQIVDAALADAALRSGKWLACKPGCNQCCHGVFRMSQLDAARLRHGLALLEEADPAAAEQLIHRVGASRSRLAATFPGYAVTGVLGEDEGALEAFDSFGDDEACPVLDPVTGTCVLYRHRPMTCRTFGPPVVTDSGGLCVCELCFIGASAQEVSSAEMRLPSPELELSLCAELGASGETIVAFAFRDSP